MGRVFCEEADASESRVLDGWGTASGKTDNSLKHSQGLVYVSQRGHWLTALTS